MPTEVTTFPWETTPARTVEDTVAALQRDFAYAVQNTAILVHTNNPAFNMLVNTPRGQIIPHGAVKFSDGTTVELQDVGMCQPGVEHMTVQAIMSRIWDIASSLNVELVK